MSINPDLFVKIYKNLKPMLDKRGYDMFYGYDQNNPGLAISGNGTIIWDDMDQDATLIKSDPELYVALIHQLFENYDELYFEKCYKCHGTGRIEKDRFVDG